MKQINAVGVIGAGPAGMTAAYCLSKQGKQVTVFEASDRVGGMSQTIEVFGQKVDIGPHRFFSNDAKVNRLWLELAKRDYRMVDRLTRIYYRGKFFYYPLRPVNALAGLGVFQALRCIVSYFWARIFVPSDQTSFQGWVTSRFGHRLFEIFFKSYSEKLWGIPCSELDSDFASQRIKKLSLWEAAKNMFKLEKNNHTTLVDRFAYACGGTGMIYERMADFVRESGGSIVFGKKALSVLPSGEHGGVINFADGSAESFDHVISTMPLTQLVRQIPQSPQSVLDAVGSLRFRNTILVYLDVNQASTFPDNWIYIHSPDVKVGRITNFRNWVPELNQGRSNTIIALEYWCYDEDEMWRYNQEQLIELASREIQKTGLVGAKNIVDGYVYRVPKCYPVYHRGYKESLNTVQDFMRSIHYVTPIGRYGAFKYNNQDHSILMGMLAAENIAGEARHDLWSINTDYESYQESGKIDDVATSVAPLTQENPSYAT